MKPESWHVGTRSGWNADVIVAYDGKDEIHDTPICSVYGVPLHTHVSRVRPKVLARSHLIAAAPKMLAMLKKLEWSGEVGRFNFVACPICKGLVSAHKTGCELAALIANAEGH